MSISVQYGLIAHFFYYKFDEINKLPISKFQLLLEQAINIASLYTGAKFEMQTQEDKNSQFRKEIEQAKAFREALKGK